MATIPDFDPEFLIETAQRRRLGPTLTLYRRANNERWRDPADVNRCSRTFRFLSPKNGGCSVPYDPRRGYALYQLAEIYPPIKAYRGRIDLFRVTDTEGSFLTLVDVTAYTTGGASVWMEAQYGTSPRSHSARDLARIERAFQEAGLTYVIMNEINFGFGTRHNVNAIFKSRNVKASTPQRQAAIDHIRDRHATIGSCAELFEDHPRPEEVVYALMAHGHLEIAMEQPLSGETPVYRPGVPFWVKSWP